MKYLIQGYFSNYAIIGEILSSGIQVLTRLGSSELFLKLGFFLFKALDLMLHLVKLSRVLTVSFIKFVPCSESFIKIFCNFCIILSQGVPIIYGLI